MISKLVRLSTGAFVCAFVTMLVMLVVSMIPVDEAMARDKDLKPHVLPGDGDGIGGYKGYEFAEPPSDVISGSQSETSLRFEGTYVLIYWECFSPWLSNFCFIVKR